MVKDHSNSKRRNPHATTTWTTLCDDSKVFNMHHSSDRIAHTTAFVTPIVDFWLERKIAQFVFVLLRLKCGSYRQISEFVVQIKIPVSVSMYPNACSFIRIAVCRYQIL